MIKKFEYFKWNDDVTEKTIDLGELYNEQNGSPNIIMIILGYETRDSKTDNIKSVFLESKSNKNTIYQIISRNMQYFTLRKDRKGIEFYMKDYSDIREGSLYFENFKNVNLKIKYIKRNYTDDDPYGEED